MKDLSGPELAELLRESFPEMKLAEFDNHLQPLSDADTRQLRADVDAEHDRISEDIINAHTSRCAALSGFAEQFLEWVRAGNEDPIRRALALIDQLLAATPAMP